MSGTSIQWLIAEYTVFSTGTMLNILLVCLFAKRVKKSDFILIDFVQSFVDLLTCMAYIFSVTVQTMPSGGPTWRWIVCLAFEPMTVTWMLHAVRTNVNLVVAIYLFIKIVFPFVRSSSKAYRFYIICAPIAIVLVLFAAVPHIYDRRYVEETQVCLYVRPETYSSMQKTGLMLRQSVMLNFVYNYLIPCLGSIYCYHHIFRSLRASGKTNKMSFVYREIRFRYLFDTWLFIICTSIPHFEELISVLPGIIQVESSIYSQFMMACYSTLYPFLSICVRTRYQRRIKRWFSSCFRSNKAVDMY